VTGLGTGFTSSALKRVILGYVYRQSLRLANVVFFQNKDDHRTLTRKDDVDGFAEVLVPGSGINLEQFKLIEPEERPDGPDFVFLFVGRLLENKGIREYEQAAEALSLSFPRVEWRVLGSLDENNSTSLTRQDLERWNECNFIKYLGYVDDVKIPMAHSDCVVLPSYREGSSRVLMEAGAIGRPVITTNTPGCADLVLDGVTGLLCEPRDATSLEKVMRQMLVSSRSARCQMGLRANAHIRAHYDEQIVISRYLAAIERLLGYRDPL